MTQAPLTLTRRRLRLTDQETERRMLDSAIAAIGRSGLTVSLDHISFEEVIQQAEVSRSAAYRRWPYKELFVSDLLRQLARAARPAAVVGFEASATTIRRIVLEHVDWLETAELRHHLLLELFRHLALDDFEEMSGSTEWRTYLALHATFMSVADARLRSDLQAALAASERSFTSRIAGAWEQLAGLFGYRLRPELHATFGMLASLVSATLRGLVIMALSSPEIGSQRLQAQPFGAVEGAEWSLPAITTAALAFAFFEPDPMVEWSPHRVAEVRRALGALGKTGRRGPADRRMRTGGERRGRPSAVHQDRDVTRSRPDAGFLRSAERT